MQNYCCANRRHVWTCRSLRSADERLISMSRGLPSSAPTYSRKFVLVIDTKKSHVGAESRMKINPSPGRPANTSDLVDVPSLITAYYQDRPVACPVICTT